MRSRHRSAGPACDDDARLAQAARMAGAGLRAGAGNSNSSTLARSSWSRPYVALDAAVGGAYGLFVGFSDDEVLGGWLALEGGGP